MRNTIKRAVAAAAVLGPLTLGLGAVASAPASASVKPASSFACVNNTFGYCGDLSWPLEGAGDLVLSVPHATQNAQAVIAHQSDSPEQDILAVNENGLSGTGGPDKVFFVAPGGIRSGYCLAAVTPQVAYSLITVRKCNPGDGYLFQTFTPQALSDGDVAWAPITAQGNVMQDRNDAGAGGVVNVGPFANFVRQDITWKSSV